METSTGPDVMSTASATADDPTTTAQPASTSGDNDTDTTDICSAEGEPVLELGHGDQVFEPLAARNARLVSGVQGGFHILLAVRARNLDSSDRAVVRLTGTVAGIEVGFSAPYADLVCHPEGLEAANLFLIWDEDSTPASLVGESVHIIVELTDSAGTMVSAEGDVTIDPV